MPYTKGETDRLLELHTQIEARKEHQNSGATYKDVPALKEIAHMVEWHLTKEHDEELLVDSAAMLRFLGNCYITMSRPSVALKFFIRLLEVEAELMRMEKKCEELKNDLYTAIKAAKHYDPEADCSNITKLVSGFISDKAVEKILTEITENKRHSIKNDPVEATEEYLAVIDEVEKLIDENSHMDFCLEKWSLKSDFLAQRGIMWSSPVVLNPGVLFD